MRQADQRAFALIAEIMLIVFASIAVLGVTVFIAQRLNQQETDRLYTNCAYLAQAGIQNAVYNFRFNDIAANGYFTLGRADIDSQNFFVTGATDGDLLMVNTSLASLGTNNTELRNLRIQNATNSHAIIIDRMIVTWNNQRKLKGISINNGSSVWAGNLGSPANVNIPNFTLNTIPDVYPIDYIRFSANMTGSTISITFVMTDGTTKDLTVYPASNNYSFTLKATGKTVGSSIYRTIQAAYNALTSKITNYKEINAEITP